MKIHKITNSPISSNCFILHKNHKCIIIDPGSKDNIELDSYLVINNLTPEYVFLTHEHFDHIWGVNKLRLKFLDIKVISSKKCSLGITCSKKNMSAFYKNEHFVCLNSDFEFDESFELNWMGERFYFFETIGHSPGSICIYFNNFLISGDTIIYNEKTVTKFPNSSVNQLNKSLLNISEIISYPTTILAGHGEDFIINNKEELFKNKNNIYNDEN